MSTSDLPPSPPPPPPKPEYESVTVRLLASLVRAVDEYAATYGISRTAAVAHLLTFALRPGLPAMSEKETAVLKARAARVRKGRGEGK